MKKYSKTKTGILIVILVLIMITLGLSYAFFNYTRTGGANIIKVGQIEFTTSQDNTINLTNVFPVSSDNLDSTNSSTVTVNITGKTTYSSGIEYRVTLDDVQNAINDKEVPISFIVEANNLGTKSNDYYHDRGSTDNVYNLVESGKASDDQLIMIGYIKSDNVGVNGSIDITAYIDKDDVGISDTVSRIDNGNLVYGETGGDWIEGRTIFTTSEWNNAQTNQISFKVKVEAQEGVWVTKPKFNIMANLNSDSNWTNIRGNVTSVEFSTNPTVPANAITSFDATDLTSEGTVIVYTLNDGLGNNTVKVVICADGEIYAPANSQGLFRNMTKLVTFDSTSFKVDLATTLHTFFANNGQLENIDTISNWNTSNVESMRSMFQNNTSISSVDPLLNWDTSNVETMHNMFGSCENLANINGLINWNISNVSFMKQMFNRCSSLENVDALINWNTSNVIDMSLLFQDCSGLKNVDGLTNWNTSNVTSMGGMFYGCTILSNADGIVNWDTSSVTNMDLMFAKCSRLSTINIVNFDMSNVENNGAMFEAAGFQTLIMPNNYTRIDNFMFNHNTSYNGESFTIPKSVTTIGDSHIFYNFGKDSTFTKFIVESGSTSLKTIDDVLYSYDGTRLISIPIGKSFANNTYEMPEGVTSLDVMAFSRNIKIDKVILPNSYVISRWYDDTASGDSDPVKGNSLATAIYVFTSVKEYEVKNDNPRYSSDSGCIYSKDGTELIAVPVHYTGVLNIKNGTTTIGQEAFWVQRKSSIDSITQINIPASVTTIEANQLSTLNALISRSTNPVTITIDSGNTAYHIVNNQIVAI